MAEIYGVTSDGFVLKRMDDILDEIHSDLTEGFGYDTKLYRPSYLDTLVTTFAGQIADLWETAQESYYAKYPATAEGVNLDNAAQYGGVTREPAQTTLYPVHCTGEDGTTVEEGTVVQTDTLPEIRLRSIAEETLTRENCNAISIRVATAADKTEYTVTINTKPYSFTSASNDELAILKGLASAITDTGYDMEVDEEEVVLNIYDKTKTRSNDIELSNNLTTATVTTVIAFETEEYGAIYIPNGVINKIVTDVTGLESVSNMLKPTYGREIETDEEFRASYFAKAALRSTTMIDSISSELLNNVPDIESVSGYENDTDETDAEGRPPHSIEMVIRGGDDESIASAILMRKAGGINTFGSTVVNVTTQYGDTIPIRFNRPESVYVWLKIDITASKDDVPSNWSNLTKESVMKDTAELSSGDSLYIQRIIEGIYDSVSGVKYVSITAGTSKDTATKPESYAASNLEVSTRQILLMDEDRIEVTLNGNS